MKTPRATGASRKKGARPPPLIPEADPADALGMDDFLAMTSADLVAEMMRIMRGGNGSGPGQGMDGLFQRLDALHQMMTRTADPSLLTPIQKLSMDLKNAARTLGKDEARFLVDAYYQMQENRIRTRHQVRTLAEPKASEEGEEPVPEPHDVLEWLFVQEDTLERQIRTTLDYYSLSDVAGIWMRSIKGIGPVIAAGLLANIDIEQAPTVGHIWRFAGLDPTSLWIGTVKATEMFNAVTKEVGERASGPVSDQVIVKLAVMVNTTPERFDHRLEDRTRTRENVIAALAKRPWNAGLKRLCFLIGESFVKVSNRPDDVYGKLYKQRKEWETERNSRQLYADQAKHSLETKNYGKDTDAYKAYAQGMLPPARIHLRAQRRAVKLFLAHVHEVMWWNAYKKMPPVPFVFDRMEGHVHRLDIPNIEILVPDLYEAKQRAQRGKR